MSSASPVRDGFRTAFREPAVVLAEIAWRWTFGLATFALLTVSLLAYLDTLSVTNVDLLALQSHRRFMVANVVAHIFHHSGSRLVALIVILVPAVFFLWIAAATVGRAATLKALLRREESIALRPQLGLNFLRASVVLASLIAYLGAAIIAGRVAGDDLRPGIFVSVFLLLALLIVFVRSRISWFLYLGAICAAHQGRDSFGAIIDAVALSRRHAGAFLGAGAVFGAIGAVHMLVTGVVALLAFSLFAGKAPPGVTLVVLLWIALVYFAVSDFLYIARLAGYVALEQSDRTPPAPVHMAPEAAPPAPETPPPAPDLPPVLPEEPGGQYL